MSSSILWADIYEYSIPNASKAYGLDKVFQVFGHTRLDAEHADMVEFNNLALIDSQQCFIVDSTIPQKIITLREYELMKK